MGHVTTVTRRRRDYRLPSAEEMLRICRQEWKTGAPSTP
jgi:hypothetical protein